MKRFALLLAVIVVLCGFGAAHAADWRFGVQGSFDEGIDTLGIGVRAEVDLGTMVPGLSGALHGNYYLGYDYADVFDFNADVRYDLPIPKVDTYAGGGLNVSYYSWDYDLYDEGDIEFGLNALAGIRFDLGSVQPFVEVRYTVNKATYDIGNRGFGICGGVLF
jgi:hypothetical protein